MKQPLWDKAFIINLDRRQDRLAHARIQCAIADIKADVFSGYDRPLYCGTPNGNMGCTASHRAMLELCAFHKWPRTLVLEDDFVSLHVDVAHRLADLEVPDFDLLYLGGHYGGAPISRINKGIIRCNTMLTTSSYIVTCEHARRMAPQISGIGPIDNLYSGFAKDHRHYIVQPRLFAQYASHSDLCDHTRDNVPCMTDTRHERMV